MANSTARVPALIVAAPASGSGKTFLTLALLRHFRNAGRNVGAFKVGPDYIDPAFHRAASGGACRNLDPWAMRPEVLDENLRAASAGADLVIGEGVMGLFDGASDGTGSTADLARRLRLPVLLVIDVRGQAASAAATVQGFRDFEPDVDIAGGICNRVGGKGHAKLLSQAIAKTGVPLLGCLPRSAELSLPSRHLGLVQADERDDLDAFLEQAGGFVAEHLDMEAIAALARTPSVEVGGPAVSPLRPLGQRIAVARDIAFGFLYDGILEGWRSQGAEVVEFSPLADEAPPPTSDAVYLPGGYPELHAGALSAKANFMRGLCLIVEAGGAIYGECGGYMALGEGIIDAQGARHAMAGLLPLVTSFENPRLHLGYRHMRLLADTPLGPAGASFRGHEFHYASIVGEASGGAAFQAADAREHDLGPAGLRQGRVFGSFLHLIDSAP